MTCSKALNILKKRRKNLNRFKVKSIAIFGSVARNQARRNSDIDLLVEFSEPIGMFEFLDLKEYLEKALGIRVDLVTEQALKKQLKEKILKEAVRAA